MFVELQCVVIEVVDCVCIDLCYVSMCDVVWQEVGVFEGKFGCVVLCVKDVQGVQFIVVGVFFVVVVFGIVILIDLGMVEIIVIVKGKFFFKKIVVIKVGEIIEVNVVFELDLNAWLS